MERNDPDPLYGLSARDGLHVLKNRWGQKSYMGVQSLYLASELKLAIDSTNTPVRTQGYNLDREPNKDIDPRNRERKWEQSIWEMWRRPEVNPVTDCWHRILSYQVPLFDDQQKDQWGYIDLLGIHEDGLPVIIELKKDPGIDGVGGTRNSESPLRMLLEAAAYAVALRCNWGNFRPELIAHLQKLNIDQRIIKKVPEQQLDSVRLVAAAPAGYWIDWLPVTAKGMEIPAETWTAFHCLLDAMRAEKLFPSFLSITGDIDVPFGLGAQHLKSLPPKGVLSHG